MDWVLTYLGISIDIESLSNAFSGVSNFIWLSVEGVDVTLIGLHSIEIDRFELVGTLEYLEFNDCMDERTIIIIY